MFKVIMTKGRRLKKANGDFEVHKKIVISSTLTIREQNVDPLEPRVDESSYPCYPCGLKLTMVVFCNSNDEILSNTNWDF
jgi:hypothetical protein